MALLPVTFSYIKYSIRLEKELPVRPAASRLKLLFLAFFLTSISFLKAQYPVAQDFNTATNATNTSTLPVNTSDLHWTVSTTGSVGVYVPAVSCGNPIPGAWHISTSPNANWIAPPRTCSPGNPASQCVQEDDYFKINFNLPATICGQPITTGYCLAFDFYADNCVAAIFVNGNLSYTTTSTNPYGEYDFQNGHGKTVSMCNYWQAGANSVIVLVKSGTPYGGFLAQANQTVSTSTPTNPVYATGTQTNASCSGGGTASVTVIGGVAPYTFTWLPSGGSTPVATGLTGGTYSCTVKDQNNCIYTQTFVITSTSPLTIAAAGPSTICAGGTATLSATGAISYTWQPGSLMGNNIVVSPSSSQIYTVTGSSGACAGTASQVVTVNAVVNASGAQTDASCSGSGSASVTPSGGLAPYTYTWLPSGGNSATATGLAAGTYSCTVRDQNSCAYTQTFAILSTTSLAVTAAAPGTICPGGTATLSATGATSYTWQPGSLIGNNITVSPSSSQSYTVTGSNGSCTGTSSQAITVSAVPSLSISLSDQSTACGTASIVMTASGADSYTWLPGNQTNSSFTAITSVGQTYTVIGSINGCLASTVQQINVAQAVNLVVPATSYTICNGNPAVITLGGADEYVWSPPVQSSGNTFTVNPDQSTTYTVTGVTGPCSDAATINVFVSTVVADFTDDAEHATTEDPVHFYNASTPNCDYSWYFTNGQTSTEKDPTLLLEDPGTYVACLLVRDQRGCMDTACKALTIECLDELYIPNTFTPNNDGLNDIFRVVTPGGCLQKFSLLLYDRWGELIFKSEDVSKGWNGTYKGVPAKEDIYVYLLDYTMSNKKARTRTGHITLMR